MLTWEKAGRDRAKQDTAKSVLQTKGKPQDTVSNVTRVQMPRGKKQALFGEKGGIYPTIARLSGPAPV
jgi:hypothetical protein